MTALHKLKQQLYALADAGTAAHSQRFFKTANNQYAEGDVFLGIRVPVLRKLAHQYQSLPLKSLQSLLKSEFHEQRLLALIMLLNLYKTADRKTCGQIYDFYISNTQYINNWDLVDTSASIIGSQLENTDRQPLYKLALSENLWERRIAVVATFHFIKNNDFADCLNICRLMLNDKEHLIHKACGWMLREIGKRDQQTEEQFLKKHASSMPRTMLRYSLEKFPSAKRNAYMAIKHR